MKKSINKILMFIGFATIMLGVIINAFMSSSLRPGQPQLNPQQLGAIVLVGVLSVAFVFAKNSVLINVGYGLGSIVGMGGINDLVATFNNNGQVNLGPVIVLIIGELIMFVAVLLYFILICIKFFGFNKGEEKLKTESIDCEKLVNYKQMETDGILTEEEFDAIKAKVLNENNDKESDIEDIKKWKKLLDKQVITEQEFIDIKTKILNK